MSATKIQVGYASDRRESKAKRCYGKKSSGKVLLNGGFSFEPTVSYENIDQDVWDRIFPNGYKGPHIRDEV